MDNLLHAFAITRTVTMRCDNAGSYRKPRKK